MDAHADIDKNTLEDEGVLRCPSNGHVLHNFDYQQVGGQTTNNGTNKYTRKVAWGSVTPRTMPSPSLASYNNSRVNLEERVQEYIVDVENYWDDEQKQYFGYDADADQSSVEKDKITIVPTINGRITTAITTV